MNFYLSYSTVFSNSVNTFNWNKTKFPNKKIPNI